MQIEKDGQTIEVFTPEEVEAQKQEAIKSATEPLQKELTDAKEALSKAGDKDYNFSQLRQRVEQAEAKIATAKEDALKEFESTQATRTADSLIKKLADGDDELEKKIRFHYAKLGNEAKTQEEIAKAIRDSWVLSRTPESGPDPLSDAFSSGGAAPVMPPKADPQKPPLSENQRNFLRTYAGMSDEEIKKYDEAAAPVKFQAPDGNFNKVVI